MTANRNPGLSTDVIGWQGKTPIIAAKRVGVALTFWCMHCKAHHWHRTEGHRKAACTDPESPYRMTGYILRAYSPAALPEAKQA